MEIDGIKLGDHIQEILSGYLNKDDIVNIDNIISDIFAEIIGCGGEFKEDV